jgi:L-malate glycosyltransferase
MKIPVLYLIDYMYIYSGTEKHLVDLLRNINRERYEPYVVTFRGSEELKKSIESMGIPVRILGMSRIYGLKQFALFFELRKFIRTKRIKVMQTFHTNPDIYGALLAKLSGVPVLISSRRDLGFNRNKRHVLLYRLLNRYVDMIICVSRAVREFVMREEGVLAGKTRVIYNGIKPEELDRAVNVREERKKHGFDETQPVIGMLSNFNNVKGHKYFIEAAALIKQAVPEAQ